MKFDSISLTDCFGYRISGLKNKRLFLLDMDGTIYEEEKVFDGTHQLLEYINYIGGRYVFITNNSSKSVVDYIKKVSKLGIKCNKDNFFTSAQAAVMYLKKSIPDKKYIARQQSL